MDRETRNRLQSATQTARKLLEHEYAEQLEGVFDIRLDGTIAAQPGEHLDARQRVLRTKLVAAIEHQAAGGIPAVGAVAAYLREAAFTALNRFVALKMLEARQLVQECVSRGDQSAGFKEFAGLAPGLLQSPDHSYRLYIETLCDEMSREVKVLFDRRDPASLLWPRRQALQDFLGILNSTELVGVWKLDETIGWVYQFFNSDEERRQMRAESKAPRNSHELAVRNQFFTPRYVVQFLTDNTLGRLWYDMRQGETQFRHLEFLVLRSNEIFLAQNEEPATDTYTTDEDLSEDELLQRPFHVPYRPKKDPRDLRVLDPACGSGHFLLYAFDLLLPIYEEAWYDPHSPVFETTSHTLRQDYPDIDSLRLDLPGLILRHNLYGIDIDGRCAQIASLALWMRAQRAYKDSGIGRDARLPVQKTNIVTAEPMPGEMELRREFVASLEPSLRKLVERVFNQMELAGETGTLLRIENEIRRAVREIYGEHGVLLRSSDEERWERAEEELLRALQVYGERSTNGHTFQRRLFADDAARGLGFIDICGQKYDVVLMNPPFGDSASDAKEYIRDRYPSAYADLGAAYVLRGLQLLNDQGRLGAITNRTLLAIQGFAKWRAELIENAGLHVLADLGHGVLDAMVETAMYVCGGAPGRHAQLASAFLGLLESNDKGRDLAAAFSARNGFEWRNVCDFNVVPGVPWAYWVPAGLLRRFKTDHSFLSSGGLVCVGMQTADDFRFFRLRWEVSESEVHPSPHQYDPDFNRHRWSPIAKGGGYSLWWDDLHLVMDWSDDGRQLRNFVDPSGKLRSRPQNIEKFFRRGATYPERTTSSFGLRLLPPGVSFSHVGWAIFPPDDWTDEDVLATYNSRPARYFMEVLLGQGDSSASGTAARHYVKAAIGPIPWPQSPVPNVRKHVAFLVDEAALQSLDETSLFFFGCKHFDQKATNWHNLLANWWNSQCDSWLKTASTFAQVEETIVSAYELSPAELQEIERAEGRALTSYPKKELQPEEVSSLFRASVEELTARAKNICGAKRYVVKKAYFVHRAVDLGCHILGAHPQSIIEAARTAGARECGSEPAFATALLSWMLGVAIGRRNPRVTMPDGPSGLDALPQSGAEESSEGAETWVDDPGHPLDIVAHLRQAADGYWKGGGEHIVEEAVTRVAKDITLRDWFRYDFFSYHISIYSKSRRKAPVYWQLSLPSSRYSVWVNYQRLTKDTFYKVASDCVIPKLNHEERNLTGLYQEAGPSPSASQRKQIDAQEGFIGELRAFQDEVARVTPLWNPDLNDGVIINFAPLWRLVPQHRSWQNECKKVWDDLVAGEYDWAHLAMRLWPERVVPKCVKDRSLAIAHGIEDTFWHEDTDGKWQPRNVEQGDIETLISERTSPAVQEALKSLLQAPTPRTSRTSRKKTP